MNYSADIACRSSSCNHQQNNNPDPSYPRTPLDQKSDGEFSTITDTNSQLLMVLNTI